MVESLLPMQRALGLFPKHCISGGGVAHHVYILRILQTGVHSVTLADYRQRHFQTVLGCCRTLGWEAAKKTRWIKALFGGEQ